MRSLVGQKVIIYMLAAILLSLTKVTQLITKLPPNDTRSSLGIVMIPLVSSEGSL